jgi:hypothetical protein
MRSFKINLKFVTIVFKEEGFRNSFFKCVCSTPDSHRVTPALLGNNNTILQK